MTDLPSPVVSVVVPTRDRPNVLVDCVKSLAAQDFPADRYEVVVIDDGSAVPVEVDPPATGSHARIQVVRQPPRGMNAARNAGVGAATSDLICFVDDDVVTPPGWLTAMVAGAQRHPGAACFGGPIRIRLEARAPRFCGGEALMEEFDGGDVEGEVSEVYGANFAVRRSSFALAGPFDEGFLTAYEEIEWLRRLQEAGGAVVYIPGAWLWHRRTAHDLTLRAMVRRRFRLGVGAVAFANATGEPISAAAAAAAIPRLLGHLVRRRCWWGLVGSAYQAGVVVGSLRAAVAGLRTGA
jgi:GT2 family glycosyltransferase